MFEVLHFLICAWWTQIFFVCLVVVNTVDCYKNIYIISVIAQWMVKLFMVTMDIIFENIFVEFSNFLLCAFCPHITHVVSKWLKDINQVLRRILHHYDSSVLFKLAHGVIWSRCKNTSNSADFDNIVLTRSPQAVRYFKHGGVGDPCSDPYPLPGKSENPNTVFPWFRLTPTKNLFGVFYYWISCYFY